ncbi:TPA: DUF2972 domain-containing protein, partial [Campylobacter jejuni]|nr:DUF2972 domain-containing protein [Campylobacter jejuni]HEF7781138.1 DUF2972 domain-containing protein [Campylobacter jejuni]HEF7827664.1 DUF2972 domain-containing protein [Campylobacter jejuni]
IERVKNHLAYKLGQAMIDFSHQRNNYKYGGGYIALFKKLYKIKKQHKKEQKIYQQTIQVFPQLKYPSLEACSDYEQALKYKFHLSYMLGEVLIKAYQNWYKGSGFKLKNNIKKANKEFQIFREIFKEFDQINSSILEGLIDNKQLFLKEFSRIKNILKIHQDYRAILDNIFHNFNYFIQNFDLIEEWLLSDDFKERYKKENHPYPSLLDPKKLNDKNEKINYHNIPAELAWEMNLPLPDNYEFVWLCSSLSGHGAMTMYLELCEINICKYIHHDPFIIYSNIFMQLLNSPLKYNVIAYTDYTHVYVSREDLERFLNLLNKNKPVLYLVRDPISRLKTGLNHINFKTDKLDRFYLNTPIDRVLDRDTYYFGSPIPTCEHIKTYWIYAESFFRLKFLTQFFKIEKITYLDMIGIKPEYTYCTFDKLNTLYCFRKKLSQKDVDNGMAYDELGVLFPMTLIANLKDLDKNNTDEAFEILITTKQLFKLHKVKNYIEINFILFEDKITFENLIFCISKEKIASFQNNIIMINCVKSYIKEFVNKLKIKIDLKKEHLINEKEILLFFKENKSVAKNIEKNIKEELDHIKQHRPDIVASWKYYQEFEKMCKELDEDCIAKTTE